MGPQTVGKENSASAAPQSAKAEDPKHEQAIGEDFLHRQEQGSPLPAHRAEVRRADHLAPQKGHPHSESAAPGLAQEALVGLK